MRTCWYEGGRSLNSRVLLKLKAAGNLGMYYLRYEMFRLVRRFNKIRLG